MQHELAHGSLYRLYNRLLYTCPLGNPLACGTGQPQRPLLQPRPHNGIKAPPRPLLYPTLHLTPLYEIGYNPHVREVEIIYGEEAIREAIQAWRRFLIENWRSEPLRLATAIPRGQPPFHIVTFQDGHTGTLGYLGNDVRYPLFWGCNLVRFQDGYEPPEKLAIGIDDAHPKAHEFRPAITRKQLIYKFIYDPVLLLFYHLADPPFYDVAEGKPITAREIVERSEQVFQGGEKDADGNSWVVVSVYWYPAELLTIARERL
jgi:hypothetical protein